MKRKFNFRWNFWTKRLLCAHNSMKKRAWAVFLHDFSIANKVMLVSNKNLYTAFFLTGIYHPNIEKKHIFWLKNGSFCYETPSWAYHNSLNKRARTVFLFDSRRANKVLLVSNKKLASSLFFNGYFAPQYREKTHFWTQKWIFLFRNAASLAYHNL